ncbi:MAG: hypothetical protein J6W29_06465 [Neisseriaceae bacterium]|nr:hypothetical protein [Neisseriaceae bacterium]
MLIAHYARYQYVIFTPFTPQITKMTQSLLSTSLWRRLFIAIVAVAALWAVFFWVI